MATFGQMKQWVAKRLLDADGTAVSSDDVAEMINQAISFWKNRRFYFNEKTTTVTILQGEDTLDYPDDFLFPSMQDGGIVVEYSGVRYILYKLNSMVYNAYYLSNGSGQPFWYTKEADAGYKLYPIADQDYTLRLFYLKEYDALSDDGDTSDWTNTAQDLIKYQAAAYGMNDFRQDFTAADRFEAMAQKEYQNLLLRTRKENATGSLVINSALMSL